MTRHYVLDAWAILALLQQEDPAATRVRQCLEEALANKTLLSISIINLGEVTYRIGKVKGEDAAWETLQQLRQLPLTVLQATEEAVLAAVTFKIRYAISYADAFAAAAAYTHKAVLMTGDPELFHLSHEVKIEALSRSDKSSR
ncbi:MAG: PIN domain-containing protein [Caldilineae bacterium]|nr:PIN domain-containing protein [Anaerolineae bacterium]MCB0198685.1 PIN domain-containing protein [Anaerolineae bacterium]MCB0204365.1 PIN domain-containing protein [Anaerolineae bacterium]MCB0252395.1 PIN domain-containing protein [Anaerolineae bacterium]MCB9154377.1 PIN domain-containing protein [Caldilineae bacterium]